jgi:hypothetical protein
MDFPEIKPEDTQIQKEIRGTVFDKDTGAPVSGATIAVKGGPSAVTDSKGFYSLTLGEGDTYEISAGKDGYHTRTTTVSLAGTQYKRLNAGLKKETQDTVQPVITVVKSQYGRFFLEGVPVNNRYTVSVDWNNQDPGVVKFSANGTVSEVAAAGGEVSKIFNMGADFKAGLGDRTNNLQILAVTKDGTRSAVERVHPIVVPFPEWSKALGSFGEFELGDGIVTYKLSKAWPADPVEIQVNEKSLGSALWSAWSVFPLVGGRNFGIPPTQAYLEIVAKTDGSGAVDAGGKTGFQAAGQEMEGKFGGKGKLQYEPGKGLEWKGASLVMGIDGTIKKEVGPVTLIPALEGAVNIGWGVGRTIRWFNNMAKIDGTIKAGADIDLEVIGEKGALGFEKSEGTLSSGIGLGLSMAVSKIKAEISGEGDNKVYWQFPANPGYLKKIEAQLSAKMAMVIWLYEKEFSASHTFVSQPGSTPQYLKDFSEPSETFAPMSRDFLERGVYNRFVPESGGTRFLMDLGSEARSVQGIVGTEIPIVAGVYPQSEPAVAVDKGKAVIGYVYFDPDKETLQATDIYFSFDAGTGYTVPAPIASDTRAEFAPAIAFDGNGKVVAVWERVKEMDFNGPDIGDMAAELEIVYAAYNPATGVWTETVPVTSNLWLDHSPMLERSPNGDLLLVWQSNTGNLLIGTAAMPTQMNFAVWDGNGFGPAASLPGTFENCLRFSLAAGSTGAMLAYTRDMDGDLETIEDGEIFYNTFVFENAVWSQAFQLTDDHVPDISPRVMYGADDMFELVWLRGDSLVRLTDWNAGSYEVIRQESRSVTFSDFKTALDPDGHLVVLWQGIDGQGVDLFYSAYDAENRSWSRDLRLTHDPDMEKDLQGRFSEDGILRMVYNKQDPETGVVTLNQLNYTLLADAAVHENGFSVIPENPAPGAEVMVSCQVENSGDMALKTVSVEFYLGHPDDGGTLIDTVPVIPDLIRAGESGTAALPWTIPLAGDVYSVYARVITDEAITEADMTNNLAFFHVIKPDIEMLQCKSEARGDGSLDITAVVKNSGHIPVSGIDILFKTETRDLGVIRVPGLLPGKQAEISYNVWMDTDVSNWQMAFEVTADAHDHIREFNEKNNTASMQYLPDAMVPSVYDFSHVDANTASEPVTFTFANIISADVMMGEIAITGPGSSDFALKNDTCSGKTLGTGQSCGLDVVFSPATLGHRSAFITIRSGDPADTGRILAEIPLYGGRIVTRGDVDADGVVLMTDALLVLKQLAGQPAQNVYSAGAVEPDEKIGARESIFILQQASGSRESEGLEF